MILSLVVIGLVGGIAYVWASRGFFSALVHLVCVIVAGAIAFGLWEPLAYAILGSDAPGWVVDMAWGVSLGVPFAAILAVLRLAVDKALPANADLDSATNLVGGGLCGLIAGTISVGVLVISISFLRLPTGFLGYHPVGFETGGSVIKEGGLIYPADRITAGLYSLMSKTTMKTGRPLATWRPELASEGHLLRTNFNDGGAKHTLKTDAYEVTGRYTLGQTASVPVRELTTDSFPPMRNQQVASIDGEPVTDAYLEGFVVQFKPGAREREGRIVIGNAQIRLLCGPDEDPENGTIAVHPFAMVSQAEGSRPDLGRWRFERPEIFIASPGGAAEPSMAFEFLVPRGYSPLALEVKGVRTTVDEIPAAQPLASVAARDAAVRSGTLTTGGAASAGPLNTANAVTINPTQAGPGGQTNEAIVTGGMTGGIIILKDRKDGLVLNESGRITEGLGKFRNADLENNRIADRSLQVREVAGTDDTRVVMVRVGNDSRIGLLTQAAVTADMSKPPVLIDANNQRYQAIGYVYQDNVETHVSVTPGTPLRSASDLPNGGPTISRPDQKFTLIFRVSKNVKIRYFAVGDTVIGEFSPPLDVPEF